MKILIVDDDIPNLKILQFILKPYGKSDIALDGKTALQSFTTAMDSGKKYDLICLDIMMPEMDGHETLKRIRAIEKERGIAGLDGVKVIMTTALNDGGNVKNAFKEQAEGYLVKPITQSSMAGLLKKLKLVESLKK